MDESAGLLGFAFDLFEVDAIVPIIGRATPWTTRLVVRAGLTTISSSESVELSTGEIARLLEVAIRLVLARLPRSVFREAVLVLAPAAKLSALRFEVPATYFESSTSNVSLSRGLAFTR